MTLLGALFGYDGLRNDILGVNEDDQANCVVCGTCCLIHSAAQEAECFQKLYAGGIDGARELTEGRWAEEKKAK